MKFWSFGLQGGNFSKVMVTNGGGKPYINASVQKDYHKLIRFHVSNWSMQEIRPGIMLVHTTNWVKDQIDHALLLL